MHVYKPSSDELISFNPWLFIKSSFKDWNNLSIARSAVFVYLALIMILNFLIGFSCSVSQKQTPVTVICLSPPISVSSLWRACDARSYLSRRSVDCEPVGHAGDRDDDDDADAAMATDLHALAHWFHIYLTPRSSFPSRGIRDLTVWSSTSESDECEPRRALDKCLIIARLKEAGE